MFYDRNTALLFSGDFLMPARLLIDDTDAERASATRMAAFAQDHPIVYVLGGHIEQDTAGQLFPWESTYHPHEHVLQMTKADVLALPAAVAAFNGFYTERGTLVMENSIRVLIVLAVATVLVLVALVWAALLYRRRRRIARQHRLAENRR